MKCILGRCPSQYKILLTVMINHKITKNEIPFIKPKGTIANLNCMTFRDFTKICAGNPTRSFVSASMPSLSCCVNWDIEYRGRMEKKKWYEELHEERTKDIQAELL
jgi:hypothetical protein